MTPHSHQENLASQYFLIYDGECPFCANYVELLRLRKEFPNIQLINARKSFDHPAVKQVKGRGFSIDDGMVLMSGAIIYHAGDAISVLSDITGTTFFGRINRFFFGTPGFLGSCTLFCERPENAHLNGRGAINLAIDFISGRGGIPFVL
jgi:predicted DCC family thiol-disulfide oxidoreductase YuxK